MKETKLLYLSYQLDGTIDFGVHAGPSADSLIVSQREKIVARLRDLADRLESEGYPFAESFNRRNARNAVCANCGHAAIKHATKHGADDPFPCSAIIAGETPGRLSCLCPEYKTE